MATAIILATELSAGDLIAQSWTERLNTNGAWSVVDENVTGAAERLIKQYTEEGANAGFGVSKDSFSTFTTETVQATTSAACESDSATLPRGVAFVESSNDPPNFGRGYGVVIRNGNIDIIDFLTGDVLDTASLGALTPGDEFWRLRAEYVPSTHTIRGRAWVDGDTEPAGWQVEHEDTLDLFTPAIISLACDSNFTVFWFRWFGVGIDEAAPLPDSEGGGGEETPNMSLTKCTHNVACAAKALAKLISDTMRRN